MIELKELTCKCCGSPIDRKTMRCTFCGTEYIIRDDHIVTVETYTAPVKTLRGRMLVDKWFAATDKEYINACIEELAIKCARELVPAMKVKVSDNWETGQIRIDSEVKVVVPMECSINKFD